MIQSTTEKDAQGKPTLVAQQWVIMPIDGFLRAATRMQNSVDETVRKGLITRAPKDEAGASRPKK